MCVVVDDTQHMPQTLLQRWGAVSEFFDQCAEKPSEFSIHRYMRNTQKGTYRCTNAEQSTRELIVATVVAAASCTLIPLWRSP